MPSENIKVFPLFRSTGLTLVVAELCIREEELSVSELARRTGYTRAALSKIVPELVASGVVVSRTLGSSLLLSANKTAPFYPALRSLLEITMGPPLVISEAFKNVTGIDEIWIYGSWASQVTGVSSKLASDIDLLVVGSPSHTDVAEAAEVASKRLNREVNPLLCPAATWQEGTDAFISELKTSPLVAVEHERVFSDGDDQAPQPGDGSSTPGQWAQAL